jgi:hypothetical protein
MLPYLLDAAQDLLEKPLQMTMCAEVLLKKDALKSTYPRRIKRIPGRPWLHTLTRS